MNFEADCKELLATLDKVSRVIESRQVLDILDCVVLKLDGDELEMTGSNGQVQITACCKAKTAAKGKQAQQVFAVKDKKLIDILRNATAKKAVFKTDGKKLNLVIGTGDFNLALRDPSEYPMMEAEEGSDLNVELPQKGLQTALKRLQAAISTQTHRLYLAGAFFDFRDGSLHMVGTDGHRLAVDVLKVKGVEDASFILPRKAVLELSRIIDPESKDKVQLLATKDDNGFRSAQFNFPDKLSMTSQLIQGQYPAYTKVIPDEETNKSHLVFERNGLLDGIRQVSSVHDQVGDTIKIISKNDDETVELVGEGTSTKDHAQIGLQLSEGKGFDLQCQINSAYMQDMLNAFDDFDRIDMAFKDNLSSMLCQPAGEKESSFRYVVMPVR